MNLVRYNPRPRVLAHPRTSHVFDNLFDDLLAPFFTTDSISGAANSMGLSVDIYEKDNVVFIDADLPGMKKEDISIDVKGKLLTLGGERKYDEEVKEDNRYRRERRYGKFSRTFTLPFEVNSDTVKATYSDGVLQLEIPKPEEQQVKKITVN